MELEQINEGNFDDRVNSSGTVLVDFWATWCHPCKMIEPTVKRVAEEYGEKGVTVFKLNVDENPAIASKYAVLSIPTVLIFKENKLVDRIVGVVPYDQFTDKVESLI